MRYGCLGFHMGSETRAAARAAGARSSLPGPSSRAERGWRRADGGRPYRETFAATDGGWGLIDDAMVGCLMDGYRLLAGSLQEEGSP